MSNIKTFDPNDALASVRERIKDAFVSLIPEDRWGAMVKAEVDQYFQENYVDNYNRPRISKFGIDVHEILKEETKLRTKQYLAENFPYMWDEHGNPAAGEAVEKFIIKHSAQILSSVIGGHIQNALANAQYQ